MASSAVRAFTRVRHPNAPHILMAEAATDIALLNTSVDGLPVDSLLLNVSALLPKVDWSILPRGKKPLIPFTTLSEDHSLRPLKTFFQEEIGDVVDAEMIQWSFFVGQDDVSEHVPRTAFFHRDEIGTDFFAIVNIEEEGALFPLGDPALNDDLLGKIKKQTIVPNFMVEAPTVERWQKQEELIAQHEIQMDSTPVGHAFIVGSRQWHASPNVPSRLTVTAHFRMR